jgi:hypothetical protein
MKTLFAFLLSIPLITACKKSQELPANDQFLSGRYMGTFYRTGGDTVNVSLLFTENNFSGSSDRLKYPAICNGTFSVNKNGGTNTIQFDDACMWTADFDWSLILDGDYELNFNPDKSVTIVRHSFASSDYYTLWRIVR